MPKLKLHLSSFPKKIPVIIGKDLWQDSLSFLKKYYSDYTVFAVTDSNVANLYETAIQEIFGQVTGFGGVLVFPAGEQSKSRKQKEILENELLHNLAGRDTILLAIGGGVCGDLTGFVASTFNRGVPLIQMPTSLLAQVDSSIGGKVGINHPLGKNMIGSFYHPEAIFTDIGFLSSLPDEEFRNGFAEIIKCAVILDEELFEWLERDYQKIIKGDYPVLEKVISRCIEIKIRVVESDEKEIGYREILNFGHTIGHALEIVSRYGVKHGYAVAGGMVIASRLSQQILGYPEKNIWRLKNLLDKYDLLKIDLTSYIFDDIWQAVGSDKKARQKQPKFVLLNKSGKPELSVGVKREELQRAFAAG